MKKKYIWVPLIGLILAYCYGETSKTMTQPWQMYQASCIIGFTFILQMFI